MMSNTWDGIWTTRQGERLHISEMTTQHLLNAAKIVMRRRMEWAIDHPDRITTYSAMQTYIHASMFLRGEMALETISDPGMDARPEPITFTELLFYWSNTFPVMWAELTQRLPVEQLLKIFNYTLNQDGHEWRIVQELIPENQ
jgi:hypothetical protein